MATSAIKRQWISKPSSQNNENENGVAPLISTNTSDEDKIQEFLLDGNPAKPIAKFLIQRFGYQEARFLR